MSWEKEKFVLLEKKEIERFEWEKKKFQQSLLESKESRQREQEAVRIKEETVIQQMELERARFNLQQRQADQTMTLELDQMALERAQLD